VLVDLTDIAGDYPNTSYLTSRAYLKKNPDAVKRFLMAIATAIHEYKKNPAEAVKLTQAFLGIKDIANATAAYQAYVKVYPDIPRPSLAGIALVLKQIAATEPKAKGFTPEQLVESGPLDTLEREGFFKKLLASGS
jgi:ABC-type nitrate/sulfonate/bicarbonate transport system substrate-binding protein